MKQKEILTIDEAARRVGVAEQTLSEWIEGKIITPSVLTDNAKPMCDEADILQLQQIKHLHDAGYNATEIKRITKKIGLPQPDRLKKKQRKIHRFLTVGELAKRSGLNARTIKYWEERGIIEPTTRSEGGHRLYDEIYVLLCSLIHDLQLFGYTLEEIKEIADYFRTYYEIHTDSFVGSDKAKLAELQKMTGKIDELYNRMNELTRGIERWRKLLKERQIVIQNLVKKLTKKQQASARPAKAKSPS